MSLCVLSHGAGANGEPLVREAESGLYLCIWHRNRLDHTLRDIADLWADLAFILEAGTAPKDETPKTRHLKSAEAPAPANLEALSLRDPRSAPAAVADDTSTPIPSVLSTVAGWVMCLAEERPLTATLPRSVFGQLDLLRRHHEWIAAQEWVDSYSDEMGDLRKALTAAVRDQPYRNLGRCRLPVEDREGPCGGALLQANGSDVVKCRECGAQWSTPHERARLSMSLESS